MHVLVFHGQSPFKGVEGSFYFLHRVANIYCVHTLLPVETKELEDLEQLVAVEQIARCLTSLTVEVVY